MAPRSVLDDLGEEITGIVAPVSICMALVVVLVKALNPEGAADTSSVAIATIAYQEKDTDTTGQKLGGALLNAIIFMAVIAAMTFVLFLLFKWGCYRVIYGYMGFAMLNIFFFFTGTLVIQILRLIGLHVDLFSLSFLLFNFSVLGILSLFFMPVPLLLKQCYTVWVGVCVAYIFTHVPEWTSWMLLVIMALYDLAAVLMPGGPLKILVELAIERQQELPALIYESRPTGRPYQRGMWRRGQQQQQESTPSGGGAAPSGSAAAAAATALVGLGGINAGDGSHSPAASHVALLAGQPRSADASLQELAVSNGASGGMFANRRSRTAVPLAEGVEDREFDALQQQRLIGQQELLQSAPVAAAGQTMTAADDQYAIGSISHGSRPQGLTGPSKWVQMLGCGPLGEAREGAATVGPQQAAGASSSVSRSTQGVTPEPGPHQAVDMSTNGGASTNDPEQQAEGAEEEFELPDGIKLGLGDFIFYSMLVGRAAMYDLMTVYASYIAVISGLGITLMLLALYRKALPALPVSIALGVLFYFLTRLVIEPFVVPLSLNLAYY